MGDTTSQVTMAIDLKKNRIRIHKSTLYKLGNPKLIQLLFNPDNMVVAIHTTDRFEPDGQEIKVSLEKMKSDCSFEMYSLSLITRIRSVSDQLIDGYTYKLTGTVFPDKHVACFPMKSLQRLDRD